MTGEGMWYLSETTTKKKKKKKKGGIMGKENTPIRKEEKKTLPCSREWSPKPEPPMGGETIDVILILTPTALWLSMENKDPFLIDPTKDVRTGPKNQVQSEGGGKGLVQSSTPGDSTSSKKPQ